MDNCLVTLTCLKCATVRTHYAPENTSKLRHVLSISEEGQERDIMIPEDGVKAKRHMQHLTLWMGEQATGYGCARQQMRAVPVKHTTAIMCLAGKPRRRPAAAAEHETGPDGQAPAKSHGVLGSLWRR